MIIDYLTKHHREVYGQELVLKITGLKDKGYYYLFNLWNGNVVAIGETVLKDEVKRWYLEEGNTLLYDI